MFKVRILTSMHNVLSTQSLNRAACVEIKSGKVLPAGKFKHFLLPLLFSRCQYIVADKILASNR